MVLSILGVTVSTAPAQQQQHVRWIMDMNQALNYSRQSQLPVFIYFNSRNIPTCFEFEQQTLAHPNVIDFLNQRFVSVPINVDQFRPVAQRYGVYRVPTCIVLDTNGNEYVRLLTKYQPNDFIAALQDIKPVDQQATLNPTGDLMAGEIYRQSFDALFGWGNDGSTAQNRLQLSLVRGMRGRAFKVDYSLSVGDWNYCQFTHPLQEGQRFTLPHEYTVIFYVSGRGAANNKLDVKFIDGNDTNYGATLHIPSDYKPHQFVLTSNEIKYLWGDDKVLTEIFNIQFAITPDKEKWEAGAPTPVGELYLDELIIVPGIRTDIRRDNPVQP